MQGTMLPQEIVDSIIELSQDCTDDLINCSLVSTSWVPTSRRYLFHTMVLGGFRRAVRFRNQDAQVTRPESPLQQFLELDEFLERTPYIAEHCIRSVRLRFESHAAAPTTYDKETNQMWARVLGRLLQVQEFNLHLGRWGSYPQEAKEMIYAAIRQPSVSRLSIGSSEFDSFPDLASLLIYSPGLTELSITDLVIHEFENRLEDASHLPIVYLEYLRIDSQLRDLVPAMLNTAFPLEVDRLRRLRLRLTHRRDACELINQLIHKTSTSLLHLELSDSLMFQATPDFLRINLIPNLRSIHFIGFRSTSFYSSLRWIVKVFAHLTSLSSLEDISVSMKTHRKMLVETSVGETMLWGPCRQLDAMLAGAKLPSLRKVKFSLTVLEPAENSTHDFDLKVRESFSALSAQPVAVLEVLVGVARMDNQSL